MTTMDLHHQRASECDVLALRPTTLATPEFRCAQLRAAAEHAAQRRSLRTTQLTEVE